MRVVVVELAAVRDPALVSAAVAAALGLTDVAVSDLPRRLRSAGRTEHPTLVVLDNCEQVVEAAPLLAELLASAAWLRLLATSRTPLSLRGERLYAVGPLACHAAVESTSPADLVHVPAIRLFVERVRDVQPSFRLTDANAAAVTGICRRLDALPLALELAAPWMKALTAEDLLRRLDRDVLLPGPGARDLPLRQRTITGTVAWSYQLLDGDEQRAFRRFGALPGRFSIDAAAAVLGGATPAASDDAIGAAARLVDKSLLHRAESSLAARPQYRMLETVRAYAAMELGACGDLDDACEGLARYCVAEAGRAAEGLIGPTQVEWLDRVRDDLDNFRWALGWLIDRRRATEAGELAWRLMFFWLIRGLAAEGRVWHEQVLALPDLTPGDEARALVGAAVMSYTQGDLDGSRARLARALPLARAAGDLDVVAQGENLLGHIERSVGHGDIANDLFRRSAEQFRALGIQWGVGNALIGQASVALAAGDVVRAERLLEESTTPLRQAGPWFLNLTLYIRAILAVRRQDADAAIAFVCESLHCSRQIQDRLGFVYSLGPLAAAAELKGEHAWVARILGARAAVTERTGVVVIDNAVRDLRERAEQQARTRLGADRWGLEFTAGRSASIDALLNDILGARQ
jgi:predicted ATPase